MRAKVDSSILTKADSDTLAASAMANLEALFRAMCGLAGSELDETGPVRRHFTFPTNPMFKGAWSTRLAAGTEDEQIAETIDWFRGRDAPFFFWWTDEDTRPHDFGTRLEARGLLSMEGAQAVLTPGIVQTAQGAPVMVAELDRTDGGLIEAAPGGLRIEEVATEAALADFKRVFVETYQIPDFAGQAWVEATQAFGIGRSPWRMFVGYLDGTAVATNMVFGGGGVASPYAVATVPAAQRRGIGAAITLAPLLRMRDAGYRYAALFSSEPGYAVYRRLGFEDTGRRLNRYLWRKEA